MKKAYIQPEIELLTVSALEEFLIASPAQDSGVEAGDGVGEDWFGNDNDFAGGNDDEWA